MRYSISQPRTLHYPDGKIRRTFVAFSLMLFVLAGPIICQPAPQRSDELCTTLQQSASEKGLEFKTIRPGACNVSIDKGYNFFVNYSEQVLHLGLSIDVVLLKGDAAAFWLRLSAFDNLAHSALGTKQQAVFDDLNRLAKEMAQKALAAGYDKFSQSMATGNTPPMIHTKSDRANLGAMTGSNGVIILMASADVKDIDKMKRKREADAAGGIATWRRILALSLKAFAAGAQGYANAYQRMQANSAVSQAPRACYTNFVGATAFTHCY